MIFKPRNAARQSVWQSFLYRSNLAEAPYAILCGIPFSREAARGLAADVPWMARGATDVAHRVARVWHQDGVPVSADEPPVGARASADAGLKGERHGADAKRGGRNGGSSGHCDSPSGSPNRNPRSGNRG